MPRTCERTGTLQINIASSSFLLSQPPEQLYALTPSTRPGSVFQFLSAGSGSVLESKSFDSPIANSQTILIYFGTLPLLDPQFHQKGQDGCPTAVPNSVHGRAVRDALSNWNLKDSSATKHVPCLEPCRHISIAHYRASRTSCWSRPKNCLQRASMDKHIRQGRFGPGSSCPSSERQEAGRTRKRPC